jgi:hypothetical protein
VGKKVECKDNMENLMVSTKSGFSKKVIKGKNQKNKMKKSNKNLLEEIYVQHKLRTFDEMFSSINVQLNETLLNQNRPNKRMEKKI